MSSVVCVVGSSSIDLFVRAARLPNTGETVLGSSFAKAFGGKGANQAVQCAILGTRVVFVGRVGNTSEGRDIVNNFESRGIGNTLFKFVVRLCNGRFVSVRFRLVQTFRMSTLPILFPLVWH